MKYKIQSVFMVIALLLVIAGCKKQDYSSPASGSPGANEVWIQNMAFTPSSITISVNTTIQWTNKDGTTHTVTGNTGSFDSGSMGNGSTYSHKFITAGTFPYHCSIHSSMTGTVIVQ
jgi:plastocyanin